MRDGKIDLRKTDMNLLHPFRVLLATRSTVKAAEELGKTQSAVSHALARLRILFDDQLFIRKGWALEPTPRALSLERVVDRILGEVETMLREPDGFDPKSSAREFRISVPELFTSRFAQIFQTANEQAPNVSFSLERISGKSANALLSNQTDLMIAPFISGLSEDIESRRFWNLEWAVFGSEASGIQEGLDFDSWLAKNHIQVRTGSGSRSPVDDALMSIGKSRNTIVRVSDFQSAIILASQSDLLFTGPKQPFAEIAKSLGLLAAECPFDLPKIPLLVYWSKLRSDDPALRWILDLFPEKS